MLADDLRIVRDGFTAIQERDAGNAGTREYAWGLNKGGGIGGLLTMRQTGQDYDYLYDGKGNVSAVIDSTQAVVASYRYDSFGRLKTQSGSLDQPYQFSTKRYSAGSGLNYYGYRFYASAIGHCPQGPNLKCKGDGPAGRHRPLCQTDRKSHQPDTTQGDSW